MTSKRPHLDALVPVASAAKLLGLQPATVYRYFRRGLLTPVRIGRTTMLTLAEIDRYRRDKRNPGRQPRG